MGIGIEDTRYRGFMLSSWTSKDIQKDVNTALDYKN